MNLNPNETDYIKRAAPRPTTRALFLTTLVLLGVLTVHLEAAAKGLSPKLRSNLEEQAFLCGWVGQTAKAVGVSISGLETDFLVSTKSIGADDIDLQFLRSKLSLGELDAARDGYTKRNSRTMPEENRNKLQEGLEKCRKPFRQ